MSEFLKLPCTAFRGGSLLATGALLDVARAVKAEFDRDPNVAALTFDDSTGAQLDFDLSGTPAEFVERLSARARYESTVAAERLASGRSAAATSAAESGSVESGVAASARGRGRPKLGVTAREVTLLPRHWEWLAAQPGTASQVLRRLVDEARRADGGASAARAAREHAYAFIAAIGGNLPGFEEATRALFAGDRARFERETAAWDTDIRDYALRLAWCSP